MKRRALLLGTQQGQACAEHHDVVCELLAVLGDAEPALGETSWLFRGVLCLKILLLLGSVCLRGYEGVKFEIMHSLHIPHR